MTRISGSNVRDGYAALTARCCLETANAEDASLRPVWHRGADHLGAHGLSAELAAAVSNEGGLGGVGSLFRTSAAVKRDIDTVRKLTSRPFAINHIAQTLDAEALA